jgi:hypothetical protein
MLRGLDVPGDTGGSVVPTMLTVAGRTELDAEVAVYLRENAPRPERERQAIVLGEMDRLAAAGVHEEVAVESWSDVSTRDRYAEFVDAVGADPLEP